MVTSEAVLPRVTIPPAKPSLNEGLIAYLEGLVSQARTAAAVFTQYTQEDVDRIVKPMVVAGLEQAQYLARLAIEETKLGVMEDKAIKNMVETAVKHGAPEGVFTCMESHNLQDNAYMMHHKDVGLIDATGGPGMVKAAYSSGKPALGVGPGNTPVYLEKSADLDMAVVDIITSKTFDNGTICASEQTVVIDDEIYDIVLEKFAELGSHICNEKETELLGRTVIDPKTGFMQPMAVGQKATTIARMIGLSVKPNT